MIDEFKINEYTWSVVIVPEDSDLLIDRLGNHTVATTDPNTFCIYISENIDGYFKKRVVAHELGHVFCFSYGLLYEIKECCYPEKAIFMEEFVCNFVADYGEEIFKITYQIIGDDALYHVPKYLERLVA